jgi:hypothetical protein
MRTRHTFVHFTAALTALAAGCGESSTSPAGNGMVHISNYVVNPQSVECAMTPTNPPRNNGSPDSVALQVTLVNTTANSVTLTSAGSQGTVTRSSDTTDVLASAMTYATLPYTPQGATVRPLDGQVAFTLMLPTIPFCNTKPVGYRGYQDVNMTVVLLASTGEYHTVPKAIHVVWQ